MVAKHFGGGVAMGVYYEGNAILDRLANEGHGQHFWWASGNAWAIVYGDGEGRPRLMVAAVASADLLGSIAGPEKRLASTVQWFAGELGLPWLHLRFDPTATSLGEVGLRVDGGRGALASAERLAGAFADAGVAVRSGQTAKAVNDRTSSVFHGWQRDRLGREVVVTDLDLCRLEGGRPCELLELKRSRLPLSAWAPFPADFPNYRLLAHIGVAAGLSVRVLYNELTAGPPRQDRTDNVLLIDVLDDSPTFSRGRQMTFEDWAKGGCR